MVNKCKKKNIARYVYKLFTSFITLVFPTYFALYLSFYYKFIYLQSQPELVVQKSTQKSAKQFGNGFLLMLSLLEMLFHEHIYTSSISSLPLTAVLCFLFY